MSRVRRFSRSWYGAGADEEEEEERARWVQNIIIFLVLVIKVVSVINKVIVFMFLLYVIKIVLFGHQHGQGDHGQVAEHLAARPEGEPERWGGWGGGGGGGEGSHQEDQQGISDYQDIQ